MRVITEFPRPVREIEHIWIPLSDGTRLAARIWLPEDAEQNPVPGILEYLPYRKGDGTAVRDSVHHPYFAGHGYASIRVDIRGSGDSEGVLLDEYLPREQEDALEVLSWIAAQPWSTGKVGMYGKSWGGFNGLQVAAHRPSELKAVISLCSTDDRYADDVHYKGGCVLASKMLYWASTMLVNCALPPDPKNAGDKWREMWSDRLNHLAPFVDIWMAHQMRDAYWKQGSVCENFSAITCAVYVVGGWADGYTNAIPRLLEGLSCPKKGLIGPWAHQFPERGTPGPAIGFLQECLRWWDYWLKGIDTGIMEEPALRVWMQESKKPAVDHKTWPGFWIDEPLWPRGEVREYPLGMDGSLGEESRQVGDMVISGTLAHGQDSGNWCPMGVIGDYPPDQRAEDGRSVTFTSQPLEESLDILGFPEVSMRLSANRERALISVRLCEVFPDGTSALLSWGLLNLAHGEAHERVRYLKPDEIFDVAVRLDAIGCRISEGHALRVSLSPAYWPQAWPSPEPVTLRLNGGCLRLPIWSGEALKAPYDEPEGACELKHSVLRKSGRFPIGHWHAVDEKLIYEVLTDGGRLRFEDGLELDEWAKDLWEIKMANPLSATAKCERKIELVRGAWRVRVETQSTMRCDERLFYLTNNVVVHEGEKAIFHRDWHSEVPREGC